MQHCVAPQSVLGRGIFRGASNTQRKENNNEQHSFDFMSGGEMEEWGVGER